MNFLLKVLFLCLVFVKYHFPLLPHPWTTGSCCVFAHLFRHTSLNTNILLTKHLTGTTDKTKSCSEVKTGMKRQKTLMFLFAFACFLRTTWCDCVHAWKWSAFPVHPKGQREQKHCWGLPPLLDREAFCRSPRQHFLWSVACWLNHIFLHKCNHKI